MSRRAYDSSGRQRAAAASREAMVDAAHSLFTQQGYAATTVADIAEVAGVAPATVNAAFGGKAGLLKRLVDIAVVGDDEPVPLAERDVVHDIVAESDAHVQCQMLATLISDVHERLGPLHDVLQQAAGADKQVRAQLEQEQRGRREGMVEFVQTLGPGALRAGIGVDRAADAVWALTDPRMYAGLVIERGWAKGEYEQWLARQLASALIDS